MNKIDQFESLAEHVVEGTFVRLFSDRLSPSKVAAHLERAIEEHQTSAEGQLDHAPTHYWIYLNPDDHRALTLDDQEEGRMAAERAVAQQIEALVSETGLTLEGPPVVHIWADEQIGRREIRVDTSSALSDGTDVEATRKMNAAGDLAAEESLVEAPDGRPFFIVEGQRHIDLRLARVSIGRALNNDVIIDDPRVSRYHAQLRHRYGHYVLYDLGSSGGTRINDYPIEECVLHSGDVISFAGVDVVYGEDPPTPIPLPAEDDTPLLSRSDLDD